MSIGAIETSYAGRMFRSRLEARWAVFFDALRIEWHYEPQGFEADGHRYLPDFYLPVAKAYVEVKGDPEGLVAEKTRMTAVIKGTNCMGSEGVLLLGEIPRPQRLIVAHPFLALKDGEVERQWMFWGNSKDGKYRPGIFEGGLLSVLVGVARDKEWCPTARALAGVHDWPGVDDAYQSAASARFEYGQRGGRA